MYIILSYLLANIKDFVIWNHYYSAYLSGSIIYLNNQKISI